MTTEQVYKDLEEGKEVITTFEYLPLIQAYGNKKYHFMDIDVQPKGNQIKLKRIGDFKRIE